MAERPPRSLAERLDDDRQRRKDAGQPAPMMLTDNMIRGLNKLFGISEEATEAFIKDHPSPFNGLDPTTSETGNPTHDKPNL